MRAVEPGFIKELFFAPAFWYFVRTDAATIGILSAHLSGIHCHRALGWDLRPKIRHAILASEISRSIVYGGDWEVDIEERLRGCLRRKFC
ncbi:MAG: hypothetical protein JRF51_07535 [Deltaproteobacteria bacterium]|nr:hypothetical protein [Deltaproteobacteria bacterium]HDZ90449.1 hypothetical protein [Deltaproteobacteria bacterium]